MMYLLIPIILLINMETKTIARFGDGFGDSQDCI